MKIIALAGKSNSGKTTLCNELEKYGYKTINFATPLKLLFSKISNISLEYIEILKNKCEKFQFTVKMKDALVSELSIHENILQPHLELLSFYTVRQFLQIIGTEIIRNSIDANWHIESLLQYINDFPGNYCIGDLRFQSEKHSLRNLEEIGYKVEFFYIKRTECTNYSKEHVSESELCSTMFEHVLYNNNSLSYYILYSIRLFITLGLIEQTRCSNYNCLCKQGQPCQNIK
jgi:hypothetical protein